MNQEIVFKTGSEACDNCDDNECEGCPHSIDEVNEDVEQDPFNSDAEADADVLANAGWGTDEDYGCFGK